MILIKNNQKKIKINSVKIKKDIEKILKFLGYKDFDVGVWFTTNQTIKKYNKKYRKKDKATDILSFPYHTDLKPGQKIKSKSEEDKNLGDFIISLEFAQNGAKEVGRPLEKHLQVLIAHGISHLLGYDHKTDSQFDIMQRFEKKLLSQI